MRILIIVSVSSCSYLVGSVAERPIAVSDFRPESLSWDLAGLHGLPDHDLDLLSVRVKPPLLSAFVV